MINEYLQMMLPPKRNGNVFVNDPTECSQLLNSLKDEAHVYFAFSNKHSDPKLLALYTDLLSEEEIEKHKSFQFGRDRDLYLMTHGLVRAALSRYSMVSPEKWVFQCNSYGRPEIAQSNGNPQLRFSVSRARGLVACLIVLSIDAGIDVEEIRELDNLIALSENIFTSLELSNMRKPPENDRVEEFFTLWTLKEAYIKAKGMGLSLPLNQFAFYFDAKGSTRLWVDPRLHDISSDWQSATFRSAPSHAMAVALHRRNRADLRIRFFEAIPEFNDLSSLNTIEYPLRNLNSFTTINS